MKRFLFWLILVLALPAAVLAADVKVTALTANTTPALTDILYIVDDPGGTPLSQKITVANLFATPSPTLVTPILGVAAGTRLALTASGNTNLRLRDSLAEASAYWDISTENFVWSTVNNPTFGIHFNTAGTLTTHPRWSESVEPRYVDGAPPLGLLEKFTTYTSIDGLTTWRPYTFSIDLNTSLATETHNLRSFKVISPTGVVGTDDALSVNTSTKAISMAGGFNVGTISDTLNYPLFVTKVIGNSSIVAAPTNAVNGDSIIYSNPNAITGEVVWFNGASSATVLGDMQLRNTGTGGVRVTLWSGSSGDAWLYFLSANNWAMGIDRSASDSFKISLSPTLGTSDLFTLTTAGALTLASTIRPSGYLSSDGTAGATVTTCTGFKNGLCTSGT